DSGCHRKASGKAVKKAGKAQKNITKGDKKKKRRGRKESYAIYIYKVLNSGPSRTPASPARPMFHHEQLRERHIRAHSRPKLPAWAHYNKRSDHLVAGDPDRRQAPVARRGLAKHAVSEGTRRP
ncbi:histone H2B-like, partial [Homalodisca vitripennis]|uniref:histone H2B-like n=1 Tax=Homalodisca vitripennis TaxID=197043 RepID=UPI001EEC56E5